MPPKSSSKHVEDESVAAIKRAAVDTSGCLGSFYDISCDRILGKLDIYNDNVNAVSLKTVLCELIHGKTEKSDNLLQMIGIQDELRLSILLKLIPTSGITSFIDYPYPITEGTRFLRYRYIYREEELAKKLKKIKTTIPRTSATHIITGVKWGIDVVVVFQVPSEIELVKEIDTILENYKMALRGTREINISNLEELNEPEITNMRVYSNIPLLTKETTLYNIYEKIHLLKENFTEHRPIEYTLRSIHDIDAKNTGTNHTMLLVDASFNNQIEQNFLQLSTSIKYLEIYFNSSKSSILHQYCARELYDMYTKWLVIKDQYIGELEYFDELLVHGRRTGTNLSQIEEALNDDQQKVLKTDIDKLINTIERLKMKEQLIAELQTQNFQYWNVEGCNFNKDDKIEQTLIRSQFDRVLCSNDTLNIDKPQELDRLRNLLVEHRQNKADVRLIYADFSNSYFILPDIMILPEATMNEVVAPGNHNISSSEEFINILLVGESGVGKSTFINAFANYFTYETLGEAESNNPVVIIPVSFLITVGDKFKEHTIKFGKYDAINNEDFSHPGQSVTQHCRSYILECKHIDGKKLRIIDTPGFGDTRGLDQDDLNMQHILEYISNLTHLNAVCLLLKPNVIRLNNYFRICVSQLLDLLGPNVHQNITFCFTNSRSTFYAPGDTAPTLRALLDTLPVKNIAFTKTNTFAFDSESFRYLVALKNSIEFSELDRNEYEKSWTNSAMESNRLIDYICKDRTPYNIHDRRLKSVQHARIEIIHMIRPILETMRNTYRNIILLDTRTKNTSIQLVPKAIDVPSSICLECQPKLISMIKFWVMSYDSHGSINKCLMCTHNPDEHSSIDYILRYTPSNEPVTQNENELIDQISLLLNASVEFTRFLKMNGCASKDDPFMKYLNRMIQEETHIFTSKDKNPFNTQLLKRLQDFMSKYERRIGEIVKLNQNNIELAVIYEQIENTRNYPGVHEQMNAVKESQKNLMKYYESLVSNSYENGADALSMDY